MGSPPGYQSKPREIEARYGIGIVGTGLSGCGPALGLQADIANRGSIHAMLEQFYADRT